MTNEEMNIAVAEACGIKSLPSHEWQEQDGRRYFECYRCGECVWFREYVEKKGKFNEPCRGTKHAYGSDLNAMHEAEKILTKKQRKFFYFFLFELAPCDENHGPVVPDGEDLMTPSGFSMLHASAGQRREAFLRTVGRFIEPKDQRKPEAWPQPK